MDDLPGSDSEQMIERGETYNHTEYGLVEVTGIWKGVEQIDSARNVNETDIIIVRYTADGAGKHLAELTDPLDEFLEAIK